MDLRQSTAATIKVGPFVDAADGATPETGLTIDQADIRLSKNGGDYASKNDSNSAVHDEFGWYSVSLDTYDTDTLGRLRLYVYNSDALLVSIEYNVLSQSVYDALYGTDILQANLTQINGSTDPVDNFEDMYDGTGYEDPTAPAARSQVDNISSGSATISKTAASAVVTTGIETGDYTNATTRDGVYHQISDDGDIIDLYYEAELGANGYPTNVDLYGRVNGVNDDLGIYAYNWSESAWDQIGTLEGKSGTTDDDNSFSMTVSHVGTGDDLGKVRFRIYGEDLSSANLYIDQLLFGYTIVYQSVGYALGSIWIDTVNGSSGTEEFVNGTADNPVASLADAITLSESLGINRFRIAIGSSITLTQDFPGYAFDGENWALALGGVDISSCAFRGAFISGICTASTIPIFETCSFGDVSAPFMEAITCAFSGTVTVTEPGAWYLFRCSSAVAGTDTPVFDLGESVEGSQLNFRNWSGGIEFQNVSQSGTDLLSVEGRGQIVLDSSCSGGTLAIRGAFDLTDNSETVTISDDARYDTTQINDQVIDVISVDTFDEPEQGAPSPTATIVNKLGLLYKSLINKKTNDGSTEELYNSDGATVDHQATVSDDGTTFTKGAMESGE
jgi:hypothetical protein